MQSLLDLLRGRLQPGRLNQGAWDGLFDVAEQEGVLPWAAARLHRLEGDLPGSVAERLHEISREVQLAGFLWSSTLRSTLAAFHRSGLPVISLKGPWLAERMYGDAALRHCRDLDLLVRRSDLARAEELLREILFLPGGRRDDYHRPWLRHGVVVELHHNVENPLAFDIGVDAVWNRALPSQFQGVPALLLAPADELLFLCLHAVRHRFDRLSLMVDLAFAFRSLPLSMRGTREFDNVLALGSMMASRLDPQIQVPNGLYDRLPDRTRLDRLAEQLWQECISQPAPAFDWTVQHRFYLELETPGWNRLRRRWRHFLILATRLIDSDFDFAARFNLRRRWQVWLLRPIRLLSRGARASPMTL